MNWLVGSKYKTRGGEVVTIMRVTETLVEVEFPDKRRAILDGNGLCPTGEQWDLMSLDGPTQYAPAPDGKSCA